MARFARYLREEKYITTQDAGGIRKRWEYGRRLLMDGKTTTPNKTMRRGVLDTLVGNANAAGYKQVSRREIQYRLQCGRTYETEAELRKILAQFENWWSLIQAGFPAVEADEDGLPYDPRDTDEKWRDFRDEMERRQRENPSQLTLDYELPDHFSHDTYSPRTPISSLIAACDESERMTANFVKRDEERRAYVEELRAAADGNTDMAWYEAEGRRIGLNGLGLTDWSEFDEIISDFFDRTEPDDEPEPDDSD